MNPTPAAIAAIQERVSDWGPDDAAIAASLNAELVPNPGSAQLVPRHMDALSLMGKLSPESLARIEAAQLVTEINRCIAALDRYAVQRWVIYGLARGHFSQAEHDALQAELAELVDDPVWTAEVPWSTATLGRLVDGDDVAAARPEE